MSYRGLTRRARDRARRSSLGRSRGKRIAVVGVVATMLLVGGVAYATIPDSSGVIHACYVKTTGALRVIDPSAGGACKSTENALTWSDGITWRGTWNSTTAYAVNDAVVENGSSYIAIAPNTNEKPPNATYWNVLAGKGATGAKGATGPAGPAGPEGPDSVIETGNISMTGGSINTSGAWSFVGDTILLNFFSTQVSVLVTGSQDWASSDGNPVSGFLGICYEDSSDTIHNVGYVEPQFQAPKNSFFAQTVTADIGNLATGEYAVGLCTEGDTSNLSFGLGFGTWNYSEPEDGQDSTTAAKFGKAQIVLGTQHHGASSAQLTR